MNAKDYYEEARQLGFTDAITSNAEPDYSEDFYQSIFRIMEGYSQQKKITPVTEFEDAARPMIRYLNENYHPHASAIITTTNAELVEGIKSTGIIMDYVAD